MEYGRRKRNQLSSNFSVSGCFYFLYLCRNINKMYIYELPFDINRELCRLLDMDDIWKELAGEQMKYSAFHIIEIGQAAKRQVNSPTHQLFTRWGQLNHKVEELFILLYHMKHVPALRCLVPVVDVRFHRLLAKLDNKNGLKKPSNDENGNMVQNKSESKSTTIPLPVMLMQIKGGQTDSAIRERSATSQSEVTTDNSTDSMPNNVAKLKEEDEIVKNACSLSMFSYEKLIIATDNWSEKNLLGSGGYGQVYKGNMICSSVAVKRLNNNDKRNRELIREMSLNQYRHDNILPLYGYSIGGPEPCLIYQLMTGGSLQHRIHRDKGNYAPLTWPQRYRIALGVANGLVYLHNKESKTPLIHGDIKPANILLDQCLIPKIGDFGLARLGPYADDRTHLWVSKPIGTKYYLPKEYCNANMLSRELDTYSYGIVLLEMATARLPARKIRATKNYVLLITDIRTFDESGNQLEQLEDPSIKGTPESNPSLCKELIRIGMGCSREERKERPPMLTVYRQLEALEFPNKNYS